MKEKKLHELKGLKSDTMVACLMMLILMRKFYSYDGVICFLVYASAQLELCI